MKKYLSLVMLSLTLASCQMFEFFDPFKEVNRFGAGTGGVDLTRFRDVTTSAAGTTYILDYTSTTIYIDPVDYNIHSFGADGGFIKTVKISGVALDDGEVMFEDASQQGRRMAFNSDGYLYVLVNVGPESMPSQAVPRLVKVDPSSGIAEAEWTPALTGSSTFHVNIAPGADGSLYVFGSSPVNDATAYSVIKYSSTGQSSTVTLDVSADDTTRYIEDVASDGEGGFFVLYLNAIYALDSQGRQYDYYDLTPAHLRPDSADFVYDDQYDGQAGLSLACDSSGSVFVLCKYTHYDPANSDPVDKILYKLDADGEMTASWVKPFENSDWDELREEPDGTILLARPDGTVVRIDTTF